MRSPYNHLLWEGTLKGPLWPGDCLWESLSNLADITGYSACRHPIKSEEDPPGPQRDFLMATKMASDLPLARAQGLLLTKQ